VERTRWLSDDEMTAWLTYLRASQLLEAAVDQQLRAEGNLTHPEYEILGRLSQAPDRRLRMGDLATRVVAPKSRLTHQVDQLVARGLVRREPHATDRRGLDAIITDAGLDLLSETAPGHLAAVRSHLIDLLTKEELAGLTHIMSVVGERISAKQAKR
jgi:DNA-binding MarR family transcriptional regulator